MENALLNKDLYNKLLTVSCRLLGLGSRFLLTFLLTKEISLEFQGEYTLMSTTVALLIILFGFDFYVYANRLLIKQKKNEVFFFKNSLVFYSFSYLLLLPFIWYTTKNFDVVDVGPFWILYFLIVFEHLGQELFRSYIALRKPLFANVLLLLRTGSWAGIIVFGLVFIKDFQISIPGILELWLLFAFITCVLGIAFYPNIKSFTRERIDFKWIKKGIGVGLTMFMSTICLKVIEYSDRYLITFFLDKTELGIYALYFQLANLINVIIFTMYISFIYPDIIQGVHEKSRDSTLGAMKNIQRKTLFIVISYALLSVVLIPIFLKYIGRSELYPNIPIFYILLTAFLFLNLNFSYHFAIIGFEKEALILKATFLACVFNIFMNILLIPLFGIYGAAVALLTGNFVLFLVKRKFGKNLMDQWR
ncbi:MAG: polysaccharide biosynthesis C-terminal domain-containing protein [Muricauda sp.]|nr:polysaccharide biosynthesis C-terminal domain-containing protein [Allomuricauda sp.]MBA4745337.1 polysaccharide biosynthesis C-terminal domain-containing protein [Allomuricauda sp.]